MFYIALPLGAFSASFGLWLYIKTYESGSSVSPSQGGIQILLSIALILIGTFLVASGLEFWGELLKDELN